MPTPVLLDTLSPATIGEDKIDVSITPESNPIYVGGVVTLQFGYSRCLPEGVVRPLKLQVQPAFGSGVGYVEEIFDTFLPDSFAFQAQGAGNYLVTIREIGHNNWRGSLTFTVLGDQFQDVRSSR